MKISIVLTAYNIEKYVANALQSLLLQTYADWECICVDDGSTDRTGAVLADFARQDSRFRVITRKNGGPAAARNAGMDAARGEYLFFFDGDDVLPSSGHTLSLLVEAAEETGADVCWGLKESFEGEVPCFSRVTGGRETYRGRNFQEWLEDGKFPIEVWNKLYRRSSLANARFDPDRAIIGGEDILYLLEVTPRFHVITICNEVTYLYRVLPKSLFHGHDLSWVNRYSATYAKCRAVLEYDRNLLKVFVNHYLRLALVFVIIEDFVLNGKCDNPQVASVIRREFFRQLRVYWRYMNEKFLLMTVLGAVGQWKLLRSAFLKSSYYRKRQISL